MGIGENPYEAPSGPLQRAVGVRSGQREDLRQIAIYQKGILICILIYFLMVVFQFVIPQQYRIALAITLVIDGLVATVFVFLLSIKLYHIGLGILLGILTIIPCLGLIILLIINSRATNVLSRNGYKVGLFGANLSEFPGGR